MALYIYLFVVPLQCNSIFNSSIPLLEMGHKNTLLPYISHWTIYCFINKTTCDIPLSSSYLKIVSVLRNQAFIDWNIPISLFKSP